MSRNKRKVVLSRDESTYLSEQLPRYYTTNSKGCMLWQGAFSYGCPFLSVRYGGKRISITVRRFQYLTNHPERDCVNKLVLYNTCGDPNCVNPEHLAEGFGIGCGSTERIARILKQWCSLSKQKLSTNAISKELGISTTTLSRYIAIYNKNPEKWEALW